MCWSAADALEEQKAGCNRSRVACGLLPFRRGKASGLKKRPARCRSRCLL